MTLAPHVIAARRAARAQATARERARRQAQRAATPRAQPRRPLPPHPEQPDRRSDACAEGMHRACGRVFTCQCPCHQTQEMTP